MKKQIEIYVRKSPYYCHGENSVLVDLERDCAKPRCFYCGITPNKENPIMMDEFISKVHNYGLIYLGGSADVGFAPNEAYQFLERVLPEGAMVKIITKCKVPEKTLNLLAQYRHQVIFEVSMPSMDDEYLSKTEPGRASVSERLSLIRKASELAIPNVVNIMPLFPGVNDNKFDNLIDALYQAGAKNIRIAYGVINPVDKEKARFMHNNFLLNKCQSIMTEHMPILIGEGNVPPKKYRLGVYKTLEELCNQRNMNFKVCDVALDPGIKNEDIPKCGNTYSFYPNKINRIKPTDKLASNEIEQVWQIYANVYKEQNVRHPKEIWQQLLNKSYHGKPKKIQLFYGGDGRINAYNKFSEDDGVIKVIESGGTNRQALVSALAALLDRYDNCFAEVNVDYYKKLKPLLDGVGLNASSDANLTEQLLRKFLPNADIMLQEQNPTVHKRQTLLDKNFTANLVTRLKQ